MMFDCIGGILCLCQNRTAGRISAGQRARNTTRHALRRSGRKCAGRMLTLSGRPAPLPERRRAHILPPALYPLLKKAPRRIKPRRKQIDIVCSRGRWSRPPALPFFGPLQFQAGRACYACALGRSYFDGPPLRVPWAWAGDRPAPLCRIAGGRGRVPWAGGRGPLLECPPPLTVRALGRVQRRVRPAFPGSARRFSPWSSTDFPPRNTRPW